MTFRLLLLASLVVAAFASGLLQDDEDRKGDASSHPLTLEFHGHVNVNEGDDAGPELELRRTPRRAPQCPTDSNPKLCADGRTYACICDTKQECPGGEDEANCDPGCPSGQVRCGDEDTCIYEQQRCDGYSDCGNKWDESYCGPNTTTSDPLTTSTTSLRCSGNSTLKQCDNGTTFACFCDSFEECPEGEDEKEENCSSDSKTSASPALDLSTSDSPISDFSTSDFSTSNSTSSESSASESLGGGAIAGIIILVLALVAVGIGFLKYKKVF